MASRIADQTGSRVVGSHVPLNVALAVIPQLPLPILARFIDAAIERLDEIGGDVDLELNGDERDGNPAEDDFWPHDQHFQGPGCPISDPDMAADDVNCDEPFQDLEEELGTNVATVTNCATYALEPDPVTGKRAYLGMSNPGDNWQGGR